MARPSKREPGTQAIHADDESRGGAVVAPITQATTFAADTDAAFVAEASREFTDDFYVRYGTPNHTQVADVVAALEGADRALVTAGGMGAITTIALALLSRATTSSPSAVDVPRDHRVGRHGARALRRHRDDAGPARPRRPGSGDRPRTRVVLVETPSNPLLGLVDVAAVAQRAHRHGAVVVVDNTLATPINQRRSSLAPTSCGTRDQVPRRALRRLRRGRRGPRRRSSSRSGGPTWSSGPCSVPSTPGSCCAVCGPSTCASRGTTSPRRAIAERSSRHRAVTAVHYPGLTSHPGTSSPAPDGGFGGLLSFEVAVAPRRRTACSTGSSCRRAPRASARSTRSPPGPRRCGRRAQLRRHDARGGRAGARAALGRVEATADVLEDVEAALGALEDADSDG